MLPTIVSVLGVEFSVEYSDLSNDNLCGDSCIDKRLIRVSTHLTNDMMRSTLFHECIHMALAVGGVNQLFNGKVEEAIVRCLEHAFSDWLGVWEEAE